jgi:post-segregation antitoxin (ccd killing protein)
MARVNVYLPDDLAEELESVESLNVSAVCQRALRDELKVMQTIAATESERIEWTIEDASGNVRTVAFAGRWLVRPDEDTQINGITYGVALTARGRIAVMYEGRGGEGAGLSDFDDLDDVAAAGCPDMLIADARGALTGTTPVLELDI